MSAKKRKVLGRGMAELVDGSFSSLVGADRPPPPGPAASHPAQPEPDTAPAPSAVVPAAAAPAEDIAGAPLPPRAFDVISVSSGKGGTGKSVLTSNLAVLLAPATRVTILDADLGLANIHILFNLMPRYNASHVITGERALDEVLIEGPLGVKIVPGGSGIPELASLTDVRFGSLVSGIASLDRSTDLLLVDTPSGIDRQSLTFLLASDQVMVVTTEDVTAMTDAYAVIKTVLARRPDAAVVVVVNQARSYADGLETFQRIAHVARKFIGRELALGGVVPFDEMVERSVADRRPVALTHPGSPAARAMAAIAARLGTFHTRPAQAVQPFAARLKRLLASAAMGPTS
jgi:flagellar biosynthesis protein FlhG